MNRYISPNPSRIRYDGHCLTIEGKDTLILGGTLHYYRCPRELWAHRFQKMRDAGLNAVDTYIPWNCHETARPDAPGDHRFINLALLNDWLEMAHDEFGFYTIVRPGPYICAEWFAGGYPAWLATKRPKNFDRKMWLRSDDPAYLAWSRHWYDAVCPAIVPHQLTRRAPGSGGVILFQIENEYDFFGGPTEAERINHLKALYRDATRNGIEIPIFTCWTKQIRGSDDEDLRNVFDGPNMYPRWLMHSAEERVRLVKKQQPGAPGMIPEMQGGWFAKVGGELSEDVKEINAAQIHHLTLNALMSGATIINYYMFFGGTNFGDSAGRTVISSYDYNAPLREPGGVGDRFQAVKAIGWMLRDHGEALAHSEELPREIDGAIDGIDLWVRRSLNSGDLYVFIRTLEDRPRQGHLTITLDAGIALEIEYQLEPRGFRVLHVKAGDTDANRGQWLPQPTPEVHRPDNLHVTMPEIRVATAHKSTAHVAGEWTSIATPEPLPSKGIFDCRFVIYRVQFELSRQQIEAFDTLWLDLLQDDSAILSVNGAILLHASASRGQPVFNVKACLREGANEILALYENRGYMHFGVGLENLPGLREPKLTSRDALSIPIECWRTKLIATGDGLDLLDADSSQWAQFQLTSEMVERLAAPLQPGDETPADFAARTLFARKGKAIFKAIVELTDADLLAMKTTLSLDAIDDLARIFVNGDEVGPPEARDGKFSRDVAAQLHPGRNEIAVIFDNPRGEAIGLLGAVRLDAPEIPGKSLQWQLCTDIAPTHWETIALDTTRPIPRKGNASAAPSAAPESLLVDYQFEFELPRVPNDVWVPWRLLLDASGNGFLLLNGHALGRYWDVGPQREFFLPECWLKFGEGQKNIVVLRLRPTSRGAMLRAAAVMPYYEQAERR